MCLDNVMLSSDVSGGDHNSCLSLVRIPWTRTLIGRCWPHTSDALETDWQVTVVTPSSRDETCIICTICCSHRRKEAQTEDALLIPCPVIATFVHQSFSWQFLHNFCSVLQNKLIYSRTLGALWQPDRVLRIIFIFTKVNVVLNMTLGE